MARLPRPGSGMLTISTGGIKGVVCLACFFKVVFAIHWVESADNLQDLCTETNTTHSDFYKRLFLLPLTLPVRSTSFITPIIKPMVSGKSEKSCVHPVAL